jgi:hypothetical protein
MGEKRKLSALVLVQQDALQRLEARRADSEAKLRRVIDSALPFIVDWADRCAACDLFRDMNHVTGCRAADCFRLFCEQCLPTQLCGDCGMCISCCAAQQCPPWVCAHCRQAHEQDDSGSESDVESEEVNESDSYSYQGSDYDNSDNLSDV